jgi:ATP-dependent Clp protease ATP-binding subunit ClpA
MELPLDPRSPLVNAVILSAFFIWVVNRMLGWYRNSQYYLVEALLERGKTGAKTPYSTPTPEVCEIYWKTRGGDLVRSYAESVAGKMVLRRSGIGDDVLSNYLRGRKQIVDFSQFYDDLRRTFTLPDVSRLLVSRDKDFYQFLFELGIRERELVGAAEWVERDSKRRKQRERWWGKVSLGQTPAFGADFAYGEAAVLGKYGTDISKKAISGGSNFRFIYGSEAIKELEIILSRSKEANAILVGEEGAGKMDVILDFARDIMNGYTHPSLAKKRVVSIDGKALISQCRTKQEFDAEIMRVMNDAVKAGNIILVLEDLPGLIEGGYALESDVMGIIDPYLRSNTIQVIATADTSHFHRLIEPNTAIMQRFEKVMLTEPPEDSIIRILEEAAERLERRNPLRFTYPAIVEIVKGAENYFPDGVMPDKALDLLDELVPYLRERGCHLVKKLDVLGFIKEKTNIPVGAISDDERERLMHLEGLMQRLVIGQSRALKVVSDALRRSRAGVRSQNRPIGAFLFLGPTGVGKTETAKALATVFFGDESAMRRIDMSEYQGDDGLERMIGSMNGIPGTLPVILREQPYGVILLDEFEKTNPKVLDLFLQVFDEGIFHDAQGKKANARNSIFIATSNAGAQEIREAIRQGVDLDTAEKSIIDAIIASGWFKAELLNRFDGIVLFHPLTTEDYRQIARLMLEKLKKRLREKSINLVVNDILIDAVMYHGVDPDFGARPMTRAVQEVVEEKVAEKIIQGKLLQGSTLEFTLEDFPELARTNT